MRDKAVESCLAALKFIPDWFDISKMLEKFHDDLLANVDILYFDDKVTFFADEIGIKLTLMIIIIFTKMILKL